MTTYQGSVTARICAWARAYYSKSEIKPGFNDYLAEKIIKEDQLLLLKLIRNKGKHKSVFFKDKILDLILPIPVSRSIFAEKEFLEFKKNNPNSQYLILGAGLDTFAWRENSENVSFFEVDQPLFQDLKKRRIQKLQLKNKVVFVPVDFNIDSLGEKLAQAGFNSNKPTFVTVMGLSYYLNFKTFFSTLENILQLTTNLTLLFDFYDDINQTAQESRFRELKTLTSSLGEPMSDGYKTEKVISGLKNLGFRVEHFSPDEIKGKFAIGSFKTITAYNNVHFIKAQIN